MNKLRSGRPLLTQALKCPVPRDLDRQNGSAFLTISPVWIQAFVRIRVKCFLIVYRRGVFLTVVVSSCRLRGKSGHMPTDNLSVSGDLRVMAT